MSSCLVIVDVQMGFMHEGTQHIIGRLEQLLSVRHFDHIVATKYENFAGSPCARFLNWQGMMDNESQDLHPFVKKHAERVFIKGTYSCFTGDFKRFLTHCGIDKLYIVGLYTDACVLASAYDAFDSGVDFALLEHYCVSEFPEYHEAALKLLYRNIGDCLVMGRLEEEVG